MQIGKLNLGQLAAPIFGSKRESQPGGVSETDRATATEIPETNLVQVTTYREILSKYDVTNITPQQFSQLLRELHSAGAITDDELRELAAVRYELDRADVQSDDPVNLVELFTARLNRLVESANNVATEREVSEQSPADREQAITLAERQLQWLQKFAALHADTARESLNTLA
jgi:hypothetical protein